MTERSEIRSKTESLSLSAVGGLLQARFTSGLASQLSESPRASLPPPSLSRASLTAVEPSRSLQWAAPGPSSFLLPPRVPEPSIRTVGVRRLGGPVPLKESVTQGKVGPGVVLCTVQVMSERSGKNCGTIVVVCFAGTFVD